MKKSLMLFLAYLAVTQSAKLDLQEVKVLQQIWEKLGLQQPKNLDRCSVNRGWVTCDCSFEGLTTSHVNNITLMGNRLSGPFPTTLTTMTTLRLFSSIWWYFLYYMCPHHRFVCLQMIHAETKKGKGKKGVESSKREKQRCGAMSHQHPAPDACSPPIYRTEVVKSRVFR
ncbi:uncharacterized protein LOC110889913 isoform X2 [Helianthus annuus]|uniref:uncharacterized protein LOC110889913 isoform X2 n=1 Tax=Helianthus annuus TaxID=4232 RepID=UPI000B909FFE|nr:uncharacterized protein LOC110889913 isoform X2 [Helianthus annuus]